MMDFTFSGLREPGRGQQRQPAEVSLLLPRWSLRLPAATHSPFLLTEGNSLTLPKVKDTTGQRPSQNQLCCQMRVSNSNSLPLVLKITPLPPPPPIIIIFCFHASAVQMFWYSYLLKSVHIGKILTETPQQGNLPPPFLCLRRCSHLSIWAHPGSGWPFCLCPAPSFPFPAVPLGTPQVDSSRTGTS